MEPPRPRSIVRLALRNFFQRESSPRQSQDQGASSTAEALELLLEHPGKSSPEKICAHELASRNFGDFDNRQCCYRKARGALETPPRIRCYMETFPRRGYRFIAEVAIVDTVKTSHPSHEKPPVR